MNQAAHVVSDRHSTRLDRFELVTLAMLICVAASVFAPILRTGRPPSGAFGLWPEDQLQYFTWIRESAHHGFIANRFDLARGPRLFMHPAFALSGLVHAATGLSIPLSYFLWEPVAIWLLFAGYRAYVRRLLPGSGSRAVALWLALFAISPLFLALRFSGLGPRDLVREAALFSGEVWTAGFLWGYPVTAVALGLMPLLLLGFASWRETRRPRTLWLTAGAALLISWIHPWQGVTLAVVAVAVEALRYYRTRESPPAGLVVVLAAFLLPAVYYQALTGLDPFWVTYARQTAPPRAWLAMLLALLPLAAPAALAYRLPARTWQEQAVRVWPLAALLVYALPVGAYPAHAFDGVVLPLSVLAVQGVLSLWPSLSGRLVIGVILASMLLPGWGYSLRVLSQQTRAPARGYFILPGERSALDALERDRRPGGVLAAVWPGAFVPFTTGREVYVGHDSWSPNFFERARQADDLFDGRLAGQAAQDFVHGTRARFLFAGCRHRFDLTAALGPLLAEVRHYGCATVYELIERPDMVEAAGSPDE